MSFALFADGFEAYSDITDLLKYGYANAGLPGYGVLSNSGRFGGKAVQITGNWFGYGLVGAIPASSKVVSAAAIKITSGTSCTIVLGNGANSHATLILNTGSPSTLTVGGTVVATSEKIFPLNTWMFVELGISVANSSGTYEVRINGSSLGWMPAGTGDTQTGSNNTVTFWGIYGTVLVDDLYITFGDELKWLGDSRLIRLNLTGNSTPQDWTPSSGNAWERLNAGDGSVSSNVDEATSLFTLADLAETPQTIHAVIVRSLMNKSDAGNRSACVLLKSGSTEDESEELSLSIDPLGLTAIWETNPDTSLAWDTSSIDALEVGLRVKT